MIMMTDIFHVYRTFTVRKDCKKITADVYMPRTDKKGSVKTTNSGLKIGSRPVARGDLKLNRPTKS